jgi:hypothetical protein
LNSKYITCAPSDTVLFYFITLFTSLTADIPRTWVMGEMSAVEEQQFKESRLIDGSAEVWEKGGSGIGLDFTAATIRT